MMLTRKTALTLLTFTLSVAACAQDGRPAGPSASEPPGEGAFSFNTEAWDSAASGEGERILGKGEDQVFGGGVGYASELAIDGILVGRQVFIPKIELIGPLFGGESYTVIKGILPQDGDFADQLWVEGGWKYRLTPHLDVDLGGNFIFLNETVIGPGAPSTFGHSQRGVFYAGLIARAPMNPAVYGNYDFDLGQLSLTLGLYDELGLDEYFGIDDVFLVPGFLFGWLQADHWSGRAFTPAGDRPEIDYYFWEASADVLYRPQELFEKNLQGLEVSAGISYSGSNNDDQATYGGTRLGPRGIFSVNASISYRY